MRASCNTNNKAENRGRDHRNLPSAPTRSQKLGVWRTRVSCTMHMHLKIDGVFTAHQLVVKTWVRGDRALHRKFIQQTRYARKSRARHPASMHLHHSARTLQLKINGAVTAPCHGRRIVIRSWLRGNCAPCSAGTLRQKTTGAITAPFHGHQIVIQSGCAATAHFIQLARNGRKSRARSPRPSVGTES